MGRITSFNPLTAENDSGKETHLVTTAEGHLEVAVHAPRLPFGEISAESMYPVFGSDAVYGINTAEQIVSSDGTGGTATATAGMFTTGTGGTTAGFFSSIQSRKRLRYRPGQGNVVRYTALFTTGQSNSVQVVGVGTAESSLGFGYNGTSYGILHSTGGVREIQTLTVNTAASATETVTVTLNNSAFTVVVTAGSTTLNAYQISKGTFTGWQANQRSNTVIFLANSAGDKSGTFTCTSPGTLTGTFVETKAGVATTDTWVPQSSWNGDKLDGTGPSGVTIDPTKLNVHQIDVQYLGGGAITFKTEVTPASGNNADFVTNHIFRFPNTLTAPSLSQPCLPFLMSAANTGTAGGAVTAKSASFAGFVAGQRVLHGPRMTYFNNVTSTTGTYTPLFTVRNDLTFNSRANQTVVNLLSISGGAKSTTGVTQFYLIRSATLSAGTPNFQAFATTSSTYWDTAATACTFSTNDQVIWTGIVSEAGNFVYAFPDDITLQPGETITLAVKSVTSTAVCVGSINTREDQ